MAEIRLRTWIRATADDERRGLLGFLSITFDKLVLDGLTLRRTADGRFVIAFPKRTDGYGRKHPLIRPIDDAARVAIERELLAQLGQHCEFSP